MSSKEFQKNEKAIDYQMANLGLPTNSELTGRDDVVYVHEYLRGDGTAVSAHYRSKPYGAGILFWDSTNKISNNQMTFSESTVNNLAKGAGFIFPLANTDKTIVADIEFLSKNSYDNYLAV